MSSLPFISHRLFVAAAGQSEPADHEPHPPERPARAPESLREIPSASATHSLSDYRGRVPAAELAVSDF